MGVAAPQIGCALARLRSLITTRLFGDRGRSLHELQKETLIYHRTWACPGITFPPQRLLPWRCASSASAAASLARSRWTLSAAPSAPGAFPAPAAPTAAASTSSTFCFRRVAATRGSISSRPWPAGMRTSLRDSLRGTRSSSCSLPQRLCGRSAALRCKRYCCMHIFFLL